MVLLLARHPVQDVKKFKDGYNTDTAQAGAFLEDPELGEVMQSVGVAGEPMIQIFNEV